MYKIHTTTTKSERACWEGPAEGQAKTAGEAGIGSGRHADTSGKVKTRREELVPGGFSSSRATEDCF